ncbi:MAG: YgaP family membrane protein [Thermoanaerobaculia bacterium]
MKRFFATNEGTIDRVIRVVAGVFLLALTVVGPKTMWGIVGLVPLITGLVGTCPLYSIVGISTCPTKPRTTATQS